MEAIVWRLSRRLGVFAPLGCVLIAAGCGSADVRGPTPSHSHAATVQVNAASCAMLTSAQRFAAAKVVFDGTMLDGPTAPAAGAVLLSPARVRVQRYLKGAGPRLVTVQTAITADGSGTVRIDEDGIRPRAGERWRIYASSRGQPYATSICLGSRRLASSFTPTRGVEIQQAFDHAGNPSLLDNAEGIGAKPRMSWLVCPPGGARCRAVTHGLRQLVPTAQALNPGRTSPGSFFKAIARVGATSYVARSSIWLGTVTADTRPTISGKVRVGARVRPVAGTWFGGWSPDHIRQPRGGSILGGTGRARDQLSIEACWTATGRHCLNLSPQTPRFCLYSPQPIRVPARFAGWYLFAFDQREPHTQACAEPGFGSPEVEPIVHPGPIAIRSAPIGPIRR